MFFHIDIPVTDVITTNLLFDSQEEGIVDGVLNVFVAQLNGEGSVDHYLANIMNLKLFNHAIGYVALGSSFCLADGQIACAKKGLRLGYLCSCDGGKVASIVLVAAAACLQTLREIFGSVWAFSLASDSATAQAT